MTYCIRQRIFTWGDKFDIYDGQGNTLYTVEGEIFTFGKHLHVYDRRGTEVITVDQKLLTFLPAYEAAVGGQTVTVKREFTFLTPSYWVEELGWQVEGDFFSHEYEIRQGDRKVASLSKEWFTWGDCYALEVANAADGLKALAVALVIDCVMAENNN